MTHHHHHHHHPSALLPFYPLQGQIETIALAEALQVEVAVTLYHNETPNDLSDLVDYLFAPSSDGSSEWGAMRAADGHPQPYVYHLRTSSVTTFIEIDAARAMQ